MPATTMVYERAVSEFLKGADDVAAPTPLFFRGLIFALPLAGSLWVTLYCLVRAII